MQKLFLVLFSALFLACGDDEASNMSMTEIDPIGACQLLSDLNGAAIGTLGNCDMHAQWTSTMLLDKEKGWLDFTDTITINDNFVLPTEINFGIYPNPAETNGALFFYFIGNGKEGEMVKCKIAIINSAEERLRTFSIPLNASSQNFAFQLDQNFPTGNSYRIYYRFSGASNQEIYEGYGDFFTCEDIFTSQNCL